MPGTKEGARKAADTNKKKNPNFYKAIGSKSWDDPKRSRKTGFALSKERAAAAGRKGGKKTKSDYHTKKKEQEYLTGDEFALIVESQEDSSDLG